MEANLRLYIFVFVTNSVWRFSLSVTNTRKMSVLSDSCTIIVPAQFLNASWRDYASIFKHKTTTLNDLTVLVSLLPWGLSLPKVRLPSSGKPEDTTR